MKNYADYAAALEGMGQKMKEIILDRAANDPSITLADKCRLVHLAYPDEG